MRNLLSSARAVGDRSGRGHRATRLTATAAILAASFAGLVATPAEAAVYTSTGLRCTEVGTSGDDVLVGTAGRDVLCGLGGDDVLKGLGGNDVLEGGGGSDDLLGGGGGDRVDGGAGADDLFGGVGEDDLYGGTGGDDLAGGAGSDVLAGQGGNDDLAGGGGADAVQGGLGTNWCTIDSLDIRTRCVYDREPAQVLNGAFSKDGVDVSSDAQTFRIRVHVTDDTGVVDVNAGLNNDQNIYSAVAVSNARLISGDVRDGIWQLDGTVKRWSAPGTFYLGVGVKDRVGRWSSRYFPARTLTIKDRNPDTTAPQVVNLRSPLPDDAAVNVRQSGKDVVVSARVTDDISGVWYVSMCLLWPQDDYYTSLQCENADLVAGDIKDGIWRQTLRIPRGATSGDWNVEVNPADRAEAEVRYMGPDEYRSWTNNGTNPDPGARLFPGDRGRFQVIGTDDSVPAAIQEVQISPKQVDTLGGPATVTVRVHATDAPGEGVTTVGGVIGGGNADGTSDGSSGQTDGVQVWMNDFTLTSGTAVDGWWEATATLPQGAPPGTYYLQVWVQDPRHWRSYVAQPSPNDPYALQIPGDSSVTVVDSSTP